MYQCSEAEYAEIVILPARTRRSGLESRKVLRVERCELNLV